MKQTPFIRLEEWDFSLSAHATRRFCKKIFPRLITKPEDIISWVQKCKFASGRVASRVRQTYSYQTHQVILHQRSYPYIFVAIGNVARPNPEKVICNIVTFMVYQQDDKKKLHFLTEKSCPHCGYDPDTVPNDIIQDAVYCHNCQKRFSDEKPMKKAVKLTPYQACLIQLLRNGFKFESHVSGWTHSGRRLRVETQDALWSTKELVEILVKGKRMNNRWVCHESHIKKIAKGRPILGTKKYS